MSKPAGILFDLDGTLTHREEGVVAYAGAFAKDFADELAEVDAAELIRVLIRCDQNGYNPNRAADIVRGLSWRRAPVEAEVAIHWRDVYPQNCVLQANAVSTIAALRERGIPLGVITNGPVAGQTAKLEQLGIRRDFEVLIISDAVGMEKPDARIFERALRELGVRSQDSWFVGDHPVNDALGAAAAGLTAFWLPGGTPWPNEVPAAEHRLETLGELVARVDDIAFAGG